MFPGCSLYFNKNNNVYPRAVRWSRDGKRKVLRGPDVWEMINVVQVCFLKMVVLI